MEVMGSHLESTLELTPMKLYCKIRYDLIEIVPTLIPTIFWVFDPDPRRRVLLWLRSARLAEDHGRRTEFHIVEQLDQRTSSVN